tara:strand:- start:8495 stop:8818 length:324 start_codon:yes stop_codon:yes gene_type:complete
MSEDKPAFVQLGDGIYADPENDGIMIVNPVEILLARDMPVDNMSAYAIYQDLILQANDNDVELVLINDDRLPVTIEEVQADLPEPEKVEPEKPSDWDGVERRRFPRD